MTNYPERIPDFSNPDTFPFSFSASQNTKKELEHNLQEITSRIEKIVEHFVIEDIPIIMYILKVTKDRNTLKKMAKAIDRLADLVHVEDQLSSKLNVIKTLENDPDWFTYAFSDYSSEIDRDITALLEGK